MTKKLDLKLALFIGAVVVIGGFLVWRDQQLKTVGRPAGENEKIQITVYKSPSCDCCGGYVAYLKGRGFNVKVEDVRDTLAVKEKFGIPPELEACHTAVIGDYFVEGHVPVEAIKKLLLEKPEIEGISLPGMPSGAPGMTGPKIGKFEILGLSKDGQVFDFFSF